VGKASVALPCTFIPPLFLLRPPLPSFHAFSRFMSAPLLFGWPLPVSPACQSCRLVVLLIYLTTIYYLISICYLLTILPSGCAPHTQPSPVSGAPLCALPFYALFYSCFFVLFRSSSMLFCSFQELFHAFLFFSGALLCSLSHSLVTTPLTTTRPRTLTDSSKCPRGPYSNKCDPY